MVNRMMLVAPLVAFAAPLASAEDFHLRDQDRVVFYGDSITQAGGYGVLVEQFVVTRFPRWNVVFTNAGVGGDQVSGGGQGTVDERIARDVLPNAPTVFTIMLGMNDGGYKPFDPMVLSGYKDGLDHILTRVKAEYPNVRLTVIRPGAFDDVTRAADFPGGYDDVLRRLGCVAEGLGQARGAAIVNMRVVLNDALRKLAKESPDLAPLLIPDRVHPSNAGHLVMGAALLRAWKAPEIVTSVKIDAAAGKAGDTVRTAVSGLSKTEAGWRWSQKDEALPLPLFPSSSEVKFAERAGARLFDLNRQALAVTGLPEGRYALRIDGTDIAKLGAAELAAGVNLSTYGNPMLDRAIASLWLVPGPHDMLRLRRQLVASSPQDARVQQAAAVLAERAAADMRSAREQLQPGTHAYEIARLP